MNFIKTISLPFARFSLFVIFFWFGLLKVLGQSPASAMVLKLFGDTVGHMNVMSPELFIMIFGFFEILIGIFFLVPQLDTFTLTLFGVHMITTALPLFVLPEMVWTHMFVPTLEGQYIIKNLALIACALFIAGNSEKK